jgi:hypothetical protein
MPAARIAAAASVVAAAPAVATTMVVRLSEEVGALAVIVVVVVDMAGLLSGVGRRPMGRLISYTNGDREIDSTRKSFARLVS